MPSSLSLLRTQNTDNCPFYFGPKVLRLEKFVENVKVANGESNEAFLYRTPYVYLRACFHANLHFSRKLTQYCLQRQHMYSKQNVRILLEDVD